MPIDAHRLDFITTRLDKIRGSIKRLFLLDGISRMFCALAFFVVATFVLDYYFILPREIRITFLIAGLAGLGWLVARRIVYPLTISISNDDLALFVERHFPELQDRLISAIQLSRTAAKEKPSETSTGFNSPELVDALIQDAAGMAEHLDFTGVVVRSHVRRVASWAAAFVLVLAIASLITPTLASIYVRRAIGLNTRWPQRTYLEVAGFNADRTCTIARTDDLVVVVSYRGVQPNKVRLEYTFESGERGRQTMTEATAGGGRRYTYTFTDVPGPFAFYVYGSDDVTETYRVLTKNPPSIEEIRLFMQYPEYLGMQNTPEDQPILGGKISAPQYTRVRLVAACNEDLERATLKLFARGKETESSLAIEQNRLVTGYLSVDEPHAEYELQLRAKNGLPNRDPIRYTMKGAVDEIPKIHHHDPQGEETVTEVCERPILAEVKDDHGIAEILLEWKKGGKTSTEWVAIKMGPEHMKPTDYGPGVRSIKISYTFPVASTKAVPGEDVHIRFTARDYKNVDKPNVATSAREIRLSVVPLTQLEKELQDQIEKVKQNLTALKKRQQALYENTGRLDRKFAAPEKLNPEQAGEVRSASHEQSGITDKLGMERSNIERIQRRGRYNKIFDDRAAAELGRAVEALDTAIAPRGPSPVATQLFRDASQESKDLRSRLLNEARNFQSQVITAIDAALRFLERWSSYQEVVQLVRFTYESQKRVVDLIRNK